MSRAIHLTNETLIAATTIGFITILGLYWYQSKRKNAAPTNWKPVGKVKSLFIYPLKSGRRTELQNAICTEHGLQALKTEGLYQLRDRNLVVYKENEREIETRPKMLLIKTNAYDENHFILTAPNMPDLKINISNLSKRSEDKVSSWKNEIIRTMDCGDEAAKWMSNYVLEKDSGLRLGYYDSSWKRNINNAFKEYLKIYPQLRNDATGMYSNLTSYLLVNQASVDDLNDRIPEATVTEHNFRPNILVEGANPFEEDNWKWIKIGDVVLYFAKPCTRCESTTINPEIGDKLGNNEPLRTLRKYRLLKNLTKIKLDGFRAVMGNNMGLYSGGQISTGDVVYVGTK